MDDSDMISRLPRDLLISILSRLKLKEAIATSVLSRRWEKLWTFYHGNLDIGFPMTLRQKGYPNYLRVVSKVLGQLKGGGVIDSITISFDSSPNNLSPVNRWIQFALEKRRIKSLVITLYPCFYAFGSSIKNITNDMNYDFHPLPCFYAQNRNIQALTSIFFNRVNVSGEIIEHFLSNCPLLESLDLRNSYKLLIHLRVSGETLALKHLVIMYCPDLTTIEISAPNLVSFIYHSIGTANAKFDVRNAPKLEFFNFSASECPMTTSGRHLLHCFSNLHKFKFYVRFKKPKDFTNKFIESTSLIKHFTISVTGYKCGNILSWTPLLNAFPVLQKFTLDMCCRTEDRINGMTRDHDKLPSKCLKVFEFLGFGKSDDDIELVKYFLKSMVSLEEIILRCDGGGPAPPWNRTYSDCREKAMSLAAKLKQTIPREINLVCL